MPMFIAKLLARQAEKEQGSQRVFRGQGAVVLETGGRRLEKAVFGPILAV